jgi:hypothetical protein
VRLLVTIATSDGFRALFGLGRLLLEGGNPALTLSDGRGLEDVLLSTGDEGKLWSILRNIGDLGLVRTLMSFVFQNL